MKLVRWRRTHGHTQGWVAERTGVDQSFISRIERSEDPQMPQDAAFLRELYIVSGGKVTPNDFHPIEEWEAERIKREAQAELDRRAA